MLLKIEATINDYVEIFEESAIFITYPLPRMSSWCLLFPLTELLENASWFLLSSYKLVLQSKECQNNAYTNIYQEWQCVCWTAPVFFKTILFLSPWPHLQLYCCNPGISGQLIVHVDTKCKCKQELWHYTRSSHPGGNAVFSVYNV